MKYHSPLTILTIDIFSQLLIPTKLGFTLSWVQECLLVCAICSILLRGSTQPVVSIAPGCQDAQPWSTEKVHKWRSVWETQTVISTKRPTCFTGKQEKGRKCELRHGYLRCTKVAQLHDAQHLALLLCPSHTRPPSPAKFKFRCLPFYTAVPEVEGKAKCRTYPVLACHVKELQKLSVVLSPWLTFSC